MLPPEFVESMACLHRAFRLISKIMFSIYNELDLDEGTHTEILRLKKAITGRCSQLRISKRRIATRSPCELHLFIKRNMRKYRKKHYSLAYRDVFKLMINEWKEMKRREESKDES